MAEDKLAGARIGVFGKGGAGKSTLTAMLARVLHQESYQVCVIDGDSTNVGLARALGLDVPERSLLEYYGGTVFSGGLVTCPVDDPSPLLDAELSLDELPAEYFSREDGRLVLLTAGKMGGLGPGAGCDGPVAKIARDFNLLSGKEEYLTLIDFKAGFEDSARGVLTRLDNVLVVIDPTTASIEIAGDMLQMVRQIQAGVLPATAHLQNPALVDIANTYYQESTIQGVYFILTQVPDQETQNLLQDKLAAKGIQPIAAIPADPAVRAAWLSGERIEIGQAEEELLKIVRALEA